MRVLRECCPFLFLAESNKENSILANASPDNKTTASDVIKKTIIKPVRLNNDVTILPSTKVNISYFT